MNRYILFLSILFLINSCKKSDSSNSSEPVLSGSWRMVLVKDLATGAVLSKPSTINGDVEITFKSINLTTGNIIGKTPTNTLSANYAIGDNSTISIPTLSFSEAMETTWGNLFLNNVTSSHHYIFETTGGLNINTTNKIFIFQKL